MKKITFCGKQLDANAYAAAVVGYDVASDAYDSNANAANDAYAAAAAAKDRTKTCGQADTAGGGRGAVDIQQK